LLATKPSAALASDTNANSDTKTRLDDLLMGSSSFECVKFEGMGRASSELLTGRPA
jgi:hypothetical protein